MKLKSIYIGALCVTIAAALTSCGDKKPQEALPSAPPAPMIASANPKPGEVALPPKEVLYEEWLAEAQKSDAELDPERLSITAGLVGQYPDGYAMFYDLLEKPETEPRLKMMVMISLTQFVFPENVPRLIELTQEDKDPTTRSCAVSLLCSIPQAPPEAVARVREMKNDPSQQVRLSAILALATHGDGETLGQLTEIWKEKDLNARQRASILLALPEAEPEVYRDIYLEALQFPQMAQQIRLFLVEKLSQLNDAGVRDTLQKIGESDSDQDVKIMAQGAADAMRARMEAPLSGTAAQ